MTTKTATIVGPITDATLAPQANARVTIRIVTGAATLATFADGTVVAAATVRTDSAGHPTAPLVLPLNSEAQQAGTYYQAAAGSAVWSFRLEAGDDGQSIQWGDLAHTVTSPSPPGWVPLQGPIGPIGPIGPLGPAGALPPGTQASRPSASGVADGITRLSTDYRGGTQYTASGGTWVQSAPSGDDVGGVELAMAAPASIAGWTATANAWRRIPELTTPAFTMPAAIAVDFGGLGIILGGAAVCKVALCATTDGGATWKNFTSWATPVASAAWGCSMVGRLPSAAPGRPVAGNTVQIGVQIKIASAVAVVPLIGDNLFGGTGENWWPTLMVRTI